MGNGRARGRWDEFVDSLIKALPLLIPLVAWGVSVEVRMPKEVPPEWFEAQVSKLSDKMDNVEAGMADLRVAVAEVQTGQENQDKNISALVLRLDQRMDGGR